MMALPEKLLEKLACPKCHAGLKYLKEANQLECENCRVTYRITNDIPMLEVDQAEKLQ